jgi:PAS domain S-box-containing protein
MEPEGPDLPAATSRRHGTAIVALVAATVVALAGASALTIYRLHALRPDAPLHSAVALALPLLAYLGVAGTIVVILGRLATARIERHAQQLVAAESAALRELSESERRLSEAQRIGNIGSWEWDLLTGVATWSDHQFRMLGVEPGAFQPTLDRYLALVHPEDRAAVEAAVRLVVHEKRPVEINPRLVLPDGRVVSTQTRAEAITDASGRAVRIAGTTLDVTTLRQAEVARRAAEEQFRAYVENTSEWVWALDLEGFIIYSNPAVRDILGYEPDELIGRDVRPLVEPAARAATERLLPEVIAGRQRWNGVVRKFLHKNGEWRYLESSGMPVVDDRGRVVGFRGAERDITRRKLAEAALRRSEERFQLAARASNDVLWDWDSATGHIWRNDLFVRVFGHEQPGGLAGERDLLVHPEDRDRVAGSLDEFLSSGRDAWTAEYRFLRGDGSYAWVLDRGIAVRAGDGRALRMIGSMLDITDRKEAERLKSDFVSFVSHQLRTPLSGMNWMLELAAGAEGLPDQARHAIEEARESAARLVRLVNDLLDIARLEGRQSVVEHEPVDLGQVTRSVVTELQTMAAGRAQALTVDGLEAPPVAGDPQLLRQVVANLVSNAVKYTPPGGRIDVRMAHRDGSVEWVVRDNGMGIPPAAHGRLFEKFFRADNAVATETEGTGLGLHLVRLIVEQTGGHVRVESEEGRGATFAFVVPVWRQPGAPA